MVTSLRFLNLSAYAILSIPLLLFELNSMPILQFAKTEFTTCPRCGHVEQTADHPFLVMPNVAQHAKDKSVEFGRLLRETLETEQVIEVDCAGCKRKVTKSKQLIYSKLSSVMAFAVPPV